MREAFIGLSDADLEAPGLEELDRLADHRDWPGAPIYRRERELFE